MEKTTWRFSDSTHRKIVIFRAGMSQGRIAACLAQKLLRLCAEWGTRQGGQRQGHCTSPGICETGLLGRRGAANRKPGSAGKVISA